MNELLTKGIGHTEFKDSPVGKIPVGWEVKKFGEMVTLQYGKSPKDIKSDEGTYPIFGTGGFVGLGTDYLYNGDSIVIGRKGTIDKPSFIQGKFWAIDTTYYIDSYRKVFPKWFFYRVVQECLSKYNEATGVPSLNRDTFNSIISIVPPLPEQQKIASILTSVDEVIEKTQSQINKLQDLKKGTMNELLTKGIGHTEFKDSPVGKIPVGWRGECLQDVLLELVDCEHKTAPYVENSEYLVVRTSNVRDGRLQHQDMKFTTLEGYNEWTKRSVPIEKDILFTREAPAGESCLVPDGKKVCLGQRMVLLKTNPHTTDEKFLSWFLQSDFAKKIIYKLSIGTTVTRINIEDIYKVMTPVPPLPEQQKIASILSSMDSYIEEKQRKLEQTQSLKKSLMQDLLTGKVRVTVH